MDQVVEVEKQEPFLQKVKEQLGKGKYTDFKIGATGELRIRGRLCVPNGGRIRENIMEEAHKAPYAMHQGTTKMYWSLRPYYWWATIRKDVANYVARCLTCQQVKIEHQTLAGKLQPLLIPEWKWEEIAMDFIMSLPRTLRRHDAIWVIADRLTKAAYFLPIR